MDLPEPYAKIDALIEAGDYVAARAALGTPSGNADVGEVLRVKLEMAEGTLHPGAAMQRLIAMMRKDRNLVGAQDLYLHASRLAYQSGKSSFAHSHPPPPPGPEDKDETE